MDLKLVLAFALGAIAWDLYLKNTGKKTGELAGDVSEKMSLIKKRVMAMLEQEDMPEETKEEIANAIIE